MSGYFYVTYNGNKTKYLFNKSTAFDWTDYSVTLTDVTDPTLRIYCYCRDASIYLADIMISEGAIPRKWTPAPNEIYTQEVKIDKRGIEVTNSASSQRTVITNTEFAGYYNDEVIFTLNKDETQTKKTTVDGELTVGKTKFVPMPTASEGLVARNYGLREPDFRRRGRRKAVCSPVCSADPCIDPDGDRSGYVIEYEDHSQTRETGSCRRSQTVFIKALVLQRIVLMFLM